jgi:ParB family transcriptional regulator, chromosome partitioning protein
MGQTLTNVKLSRLLEGKEINARSDAKRVPIEDLIASISAHGLMHPLIAREVAEKPGWYQVGDGNRRLRALKKVHGKANGVEIPTIVVDGETDIEEVSLALNVARINLHPVDEYARYRLFIDKGWAVEQIAARFGVTEKWVRQRLQLARIAPPLLDAWRAGKLDADQAKALSATPDHARQVAVWTNAGKDQWLSRPQTLRQDVLRTVVKQDSPEFRLVGAAEYEAAGGTYSEDLFSDDRLILDAELLDRLAEAMLQQECVKLREDGWLWAETETSGKFNEWELVDHDLKAWATGDEAGELSTAGFAERRRILEAIHDRALTDPNARAQAGVLVDVEADGSVRRRYFVDRPPADVNDPIQAELDAANGILASEEALNEAEMDAAGIPEFERELGEPSEAREARSVSASVEPPRVNFALRERLSEILTVAISRALARNPKVALAALLATIKGQVASPFARSPLRLKTDAWEGLAPPSDDDHRWERNFIAALDTPEFMEQMLALLISKTIDLRHPKFDDRQWSERERKHMIDALRIFLPIEADIYDLFDPQDYFTRLTIAQISDVLRHSLNYSEGALPSGKAAMVALAVAKAKEAKWLPMELRESA